MRALAYDHLCDLGIVLKTATTGGRTAAHRQVGAFFRRVILIGALFKVLRLPLLQESGRLRHYLRPSGSFPNLCKLSLLHPTPVRHVQGKADAPRLLDVIHRVVHE